MDFEAIWLSLGLAFFTTLILLVIGLPLAYWLAETRWRLKFLLEAAVATAPTVCTRARKSWSSRLLMKPAPLAARHRNLAATAEDKGAAKARDKAVVGEAARPLRKSAHLSKNKPGSPFSPAGGGQHSSTEGDRR